MTPDEALEDLVREHLQREPYLTWVDIAELEYMDPFDVYQAVQRVLDGNLGLGGKEAGVSGKCR
jgi:hypothetical protein